MLVNTLMKIGYDPVPECAVFKEKKKYDSLIAGSYEPNEKKVCIYELTLENTLDEVIRELIPGPPIEIYSLYREYVRLHEHIHAFMHQKVGEFWTKVNRDVDEPITEFLCYCVIKHYLTRDPHYGEKILKMFKDLPRRNPYDQWKNILDMQISIDSNQLIEMNSLCKQIEEKNQLKIIFRIFVDILRANPRDMKSVESMSRKYYPRSVVLLPLEKI